MVLNLTRHILGIISQKENQIEKAQRLSNRMLFQRPIQYDRFTLE
jgi:hypothetical protein